MNTMITLLLGRLGIATNEHVDSQDADLARELAGLRDEITELRADLERLEPRVDEFVLRAAEVRDAG